MADKGMALDKSLKEKACVKKIEPKGWLLDIPQAGRPSPDPAMPGALRVAVFRRPGRVKVNGWFHASPPN